MAPPGLLRRAPASGRCAAGKVRHGHRGRRDPPRLPEVLAAAALAWTAPSTAARAMPLASSNYRYSGPWARRQRVAPARVHRLSSGSSQARLARTAAPGQRAARRRRTWPADCVLVSRSLKR